MLTRTLVAAAALAGTAALAAGVGNAAPAAHHAGQQSAKAPAFAFNMVRSTGTPANCLPNAFARVKITKLEGAEQMRVRVHNLVPDTEYDLFVIQVPDLPFGMSWYQGDIETDKYGDGENTFIGRFNEETFSVAPNVAPAPVVHSTPIPDASSNPATGPLHQYHLGLWFNSPVDAAGAGCNPATTPFNGEHNAGVQILSTHNFPIDFGPLRHVPS
jgi:hypothetical protein